MAGKKSINTINPLVDEDPRNTLDRCRSVLSWMTSTRDQEGGQDVDYGRSLVLDTIREAIVHAESQLAAKPCLEVVRG